MSDILLGPSDYGGNGPGRLSIRSVYGDLTFEQAACAVERCGIVFSTEINELPGECLVFTTAATRFHFQLRWQGAVRVAEVWDHPDVGFVIELDGEMQPVAREWLDEEYSGSFRDLPRTALIFASDVDRGHFEKMLSNVEVLGVLWPG